MPIAIHWDLEGHSASRPLQSSLKLHSKQLPAPFNFFAVFIFKHGASIQNVQKFAPFENFPLYGKLQVLHPK